MLACLLACFLVPTTVAGPAQAPVTGREPATPAADVDGFATRVRRMADSAAAPGGAAVLVLNGRTVAIVTFGAGQPGQAVSRSTGFRIASVSKVFTAAAAARLVAGGSLALDDDVRPAHPWLRAPGPAPVTLRQLLTHTGGFDDRAVGMFAREAAAVEPLGGYLERRMPPRTTEPGRWTRYSNHGVALAGLLVEEAAGRPFAEAVAGLVLEPLGMTGSSFAQPLPDAVLGRLARAFPCPDATCPALPVDYRHTLPAGGLVTTPEDMARFMEAVLAGERSALGGEAVRVLLTRAWSARPDLPGLALALQEQPVAGYRALVHAGSSSGYLSLLVLVPEVAAGLFVVASGGTSRLGSGALDAFAPLLPPGPDVVGAAMPRPVAPDSAAEFAGPYLLARAPRASYESFPARFLYAHAIGVDEQGFLTRAEGRAVVRYGRMEGDRFAALDGPGQMAFERDGRGRITGLQAADVFNGARFPASYQRLGPLAAPRFVNEFLSWVAGLPVIALLMWLGAELVAAVRRRRSRVAGVQRLLVARLGLAVFGVGILSVLVFGFGFLARFNAMAATAPGALAYGLPPSLARLLWLPWLVVLSAVALVALTAASWAQWRMVTLRDRLLLSVGAVATTLFAVTLVHFALLPAVG